eukprot:6203703-Pleurochrysis_carterae.AAC.1
MTFKAKLCICDQTRMHKHRSYLCALIPGYKTTRRTLKEGAQVGRSGASVVKGATVTVHATGIVKETGKKFWCEALSLGHTVVWSLFAAGLTSTPLYPSLGRQSDLLAYPMPAVHEGSGPAAVYLPGWSWSSDYWVSCRRWRCHHELFPPSSSSFNLAFDRNFCALRLCVGAKRIQNRARAVFAQCATSVSRTLSFRERARACSRTRSASCSSPRTKVRQTLVLDEGDHAPSRSVPVLEVMARRAFLHGVFHRVGR